MSRISYLTNVEFGAGALVTLATALAELGISRPLLISDRGVEADGLLPRVVEYLPAGHTQFLDVPSAPTEDATLAALELYRAHHCDGLVAFGGGSCIDLAKCVALLATHSGCLEDYAAIVGGPDPVGLAIAPVVAIPTTAGTGAEVGQAALITLRNGRKLEIVSGNLTPRRAICDPALTFHLPRLPTATTGLDALSHCIEAFLSPRYNPPADAVALDGAGRVWRNLRRAADIERDYEARCEIMMGALQGGLALQKGLGAVHALSHALGGLLDVNHGTLKAILMPRVIRFCQPEIEYKLSRLKQAMDLPQESDIADELVHLNQWFDLPSGLAELGLSPDMFEQVIEAALSDHSQATSPGTPSAADYAFILEQAMGEARPPKGTE